MGAFYGGILKHKRKYAPMLTKTAIDNAKPKDKPYRLYDQEGLYLEVAPSGGKLWRLKYRFNRKEKRLSFGKYPLISLKEARDKARDAKKVLANGEDPAKTKRAADATGATFKDVALDWWKKFMEPNGGRYPAEVWRRMEREVFPFIGGMTLPEIDAPAILSILRRIEGRGTIETAHKIKSYISQTMRYGIANGLIYHDPARDLTGAIAPKKNRHLAAIVDPRGVGRLMRAIYAYEGSGVVKCALKMAALTFVRPGELRTAAWVDVDLNSSEWRVPAPETKMKRNVHIVPLSRQAVGVLQELHLHSGHGKFLFPSIRTLDRPMSDMTVNAALRAMGFQQDEMTGHGFRAMATSLLSERGWTTDAIERQLDHVENNKIKAAYHRAEHLAERKDMMQAWADYLDELRLSV